MAGKVNFKSIHQSRGKIPKPEVTGLPQRKDLFLCFFSAHNALILRILLAMLIVLTAIGLIKLLFGLTVDDLRQSMRPVFIYIRNANPLALFLSMIVLPLIGIPIGPLWILSGMMCGIAAGICLSAAALLINLTLAYFLASRICREFLKRFFLKRGMQLPEMQSAGIVKFIVIIRLTPIFPLCVQNYVLGLLDVPFSLYLPISFLLQFIVACIFIITGESVYSGRFGTLFFCISSLIALIILFRLVYRNMTR